MINPNVIAVIRKLLLPVSWLYGSVMRWRNWLYDNNVLKIYSPPVKSICVGNLSVGGTGKTPLTDWLIKYLSDKYQVAVLSRGYGRLTHGFYQVRENSTAQQVGDEPLMLKIKNPKTIVAVCEDRVKGTKQLLKEHSDIDCIIYDDAMQHRSIKAGLTIMLTPYHSLYLDDNMLPTGNLREPACGAKRADIIIVSKCPKEPDMQALKKRIGREDIIFSYIKYSQPIDTTGNLVELNGKAIILTGIAKPEPLINFLEEKEITITDIIIFPDHYQFTEKDLLYLHSRSKSVDFIITTEKDYCRLKTIQNYKLISDKIVLMPITTKFLNPEIITSKIDNYVSKN